ncbi:hypothetical protein [Streptomyces sp. BK340]|uniref:hypothetical protein n=1 Tax=Streptomyces sp. BK340 TaxID=2572903 RepID=UPI00119E0360|nr:hypothetical protein [Streptomyces sp. BK340]TVZ76761.1 hypothetical protein FB157_14241 [Streptomyces sp. BK340]
MMGEHEAETVSLLVRSWVAGSSPLADPGRALGTGLPVPRAQALEVIESARSLAVLGLTDGCPAVSSPALVRSQLGDARFSELCLIADALVVGQHPSVAEWTAGDYRVAVEWTAVLIQRWGEDGVQRLVAELSGS